MNIQHLTEREKGILAIIALAIIYGVLPLIPRYFQTSFDLFQQIYLRMILAFLFTIILFHKKIHFGKIYRLPIQDKVWIFVRSLFYYSLGLVLYVQAILITKISNVVFIDSLPMVAILGFILLREKVTTAKVLLVIASFIGVLFISLQHNGSSVSFGFGELLTLLSAFFVALGLISRKWLRNSLNDFETTALMLFFATIQIISISFFARTPIPTSGFSIGIVIALLITGLLLSLLSFFMNYGIARVDAVLSSNILSLSAVIAIILALVVYREVPSPREFFGGIIIVTSVVILHKIEKKSEE